MNFTDKTLAMLLVVWIIATLVVYAVHDTGAVVINKVLGTNFKYWTQQ